MKRAIVPYFARTDVEEHPVGELRFQSYSVFLVVVFVLRVFQMDPPVSFVTFRGTLFEVLVTTNSRFSTCKFNASRSYYHNRSMKQMRQAFLQQAELIFRYCFSSSVLIILTDWRDFVAP